MDRSLQSALEKRSRMGKWQPRVYRLERGYLSTWPDVVAAANKEPPSKTECLWQEKQVAVLSDQGAYYRAFSSFQQSPHKHGRDFLAHSCFWVGPLVWFKPRRSGRLSCFSLAHVRNVSVSNVEVSRIAEVKSKLNRRHLLGADVRGPCR